MRDEQATQLYNAILEGTPGKASEFGTELWCEATRHLNYNDARVALGTLMQSSTFISAADLNKEVKAMRADRCKRAREYTPSSHGLTPLEQKAEYRNYWRHVANGNAVNEIDLTQLPRRPQLSVLTKGINT
jgi:hypothetical protein